MKIQRQRIIFIIFFLISVIIGYLFWDLINLQFKDQGIIGEYSSKSHHAANDILRYLFFLSLPCLVFISYKFFSQKFFFKNISDFLINNNKDVIETKKTLLLFFLLFIFLLVIEFLSITFPIYGVDSFHDGQKLSSAYKHYTEGSLWSGSYVTVGIFYETLSTSFFWSLFDHISIGVGRFAEITYILIFKILFIFLIYQIAKLTQLDLIKKIIFFIFNSVVFVSLIDYNIISTDNFSYRELPIILILLLFTFLISKENKLIYILLISILSPLSLFWGVDRGLISNILILFILIYLFLSKNKNDSILLIFTICFSWFTSYLLLGKEFEQFLNNTYLIFKEMSYIHGVIHPKIFSNDENSARASKTIILILINMLISINLFFKKKYPINFSKIIIFLSIISAGSYLYALGRSDGPHIKNSFGFPLVTILFFISYFILKKYSKSLTNYKSKILIGLISIFFILNVELNIKNVFNFKKRLENYIYLTDDYFLNSKEKEFINFIKPKLKNQKCIHLFSNDAILYYALRKSSCTKFYFIWSASSKLNQQQLIKEMSNSDIIVSGGQKNDWDLPLQVKIEDVHNYIIKNYLLSEKFYDWEIFIKK